MNFINALSWPQWIVLLAVPPAVLSLYFLKLKRKPLEVPSTLLWKRALEDVHVNSIWQRLRKNLLLYLQLLFLALTIMSCLRPGWSGTERLGERRIYLLDNSASMQSTDVSRTRLEVAKAQIRELISETDADDVGMLIAFSDRADVRQGFTKDKSRLLKALDSVEPTNRTTDIAEALRAAAGLANPGRSSFGDQTDVQVADALPATVYLLSDGGFGEMDEMTLGQLKVVYIPIGEKDASNVGILSFAVQRNEENRERVEAFARLGNFGDTEVSLTASLEIDDVLADASTVKIAPRSESGIAFELQQINEGVLKLKLEHDDFNSIDNTAYAAIRPAKPINVLLVTAGNPTLETALKTGRCKQIANVEIEGVSFLEDPSYQSKQEEGLYDLIIFDQCSPKEMPSSNTLFLGSRPPAEGNMKDKSTPDKPVAKEVEGQGAESNKESPQDPTQWQFGEAKGPVVILDVNRENPMTQYLEMNSVNIVEGNTVKPPEGGTVLMTSDSGPVFAVAPRGPFQDAVLGFGVVLAVNTDWGVRRSFPVFVYSAVEFLGGGIAEASAPTVLPGGAIGLVLSNRYDEYTVVLPKGEKETLTRNVDSRFTFTKTDQIGNYKVLAKGDQNPVESFCVNLFSNRESDIAIKKEISIGAEKIAGSASKISVRKETWRSILILGLGLLMLEWIIFNRRIFI